jgi:D-alanine transfer protein
VNEQNMDAAFIIQPVNRFYYEGTENYQALVSAITNRLDERSIPYFNMYVSDTASYDKGTLMDVMHLGDYGWMQINEFLVEQFLENE